MSHYYSQNVENEVESREISFEVIIRDKTYNFASDNGVFSKDFLDRGTKILLDSLNLNEQKESLDIGTGYGIIGIFLYREFNHRVDMIDINDRALRLAKANALNNHAKVNVFSSDFFESVTKKYDYIVTNPPIRIGKTKLYEFYQNTPKFLKENGEFILIINKKHGALSTIEKLKTIYSKVEIINKKSGFYVLKCKN